MAKKQKRGGGASRVKTQGVALPPSRVQWKVPLAIAAAFLPAIFILPYFSKVPGPNCSQSWEFNFNNTLGQEMIAAMLLILFAWKALFQKIEVKEMPIGKILIEPSRQESTRSLWVTMAIFQILTAAIVIAWYNTLPYTHYGEITYFIQRLEAMIVGGVPYRDFTFDYGPGLLAIPLFFYKICRGSLSVEAAYLCALLLNFEIGYALLAYLIDQLYPKGGRAMIYALLGIPWINLSMGLQYTPLRFTTALASIFAIRTIFSRTEGDLLKRWALLTASALFLPLISFYFSPEMGLALTFGLLVYFGWFLLGRQRAYALLILPLLVGFAAVYLFFPRAYFNSMLAFGKGGASFPLFPTIHILLFLAAAIWVFPQLGLIAIREQGPTAPFCAGLAILLGLFILPAMGRCDSGHIYINSMGLFALSMCALTWVPRGWGYSMLAVYALIFPIMDVVTFWDHYEQPIENALQARRQLEKMNYIADNYSVPSANGVKPLIHYSKLLPISNWLYDLPQVKIGTPLGVDEATERYLRLTGRTIPEYHLPPYADISDADNLPRKFSDLSRMQYILVPQSYLRYLQPVDEHALMLAQGEADCRFMSGLLLFPISLTPVHPVFQPDAEVMRRIGNEYGLVKEYPNELLLRRKDLEVPPVLPAEKAQKSF